MSGFGVSTRGWRASTGVLAVDRSAATGQDPTIQASERSEDGKREYRSGRVISDATKPK